MPVTILYYLFVLIVMMILIVNIVYPLFVPKYKLFFMFRKDKYKVAVDKLEETQREAAIQKIEKEIQDIKKEGNE